MAMSGKHVYCPNDYGSDWKLTMSPPKWGIKGQHQDGPRKEWIQRIGPVREVHAMTNDRSGLRHSMTASGGNAMSNFDYASQMTSLPPLQMVGGISAREPLVTWLSYGEPGIHGTQAGSSV